VPRAPPAAWPAPAEIKLRAATAWEGPEARGSWAGRSYFLAIARGHVDLGCLRFYESYAYAFQAESPFAVLARSARALPPVRKSITESDGG